MKNMINYLLSTVAIFCFVTTIDVAASQVTPSTEEIQLVEEGSYRIDLSVQFDKPEQMNRIEARDKRTRGCRLYDIVEAPEINYYSSGETLSFEFSEIGEGTWEYFIVAYDDEGNEFFYYENSFNVIPIQVQIPEEPIVEETVFENSVSENTVSENTITGEKAEVEDSETYEVVEESDINDSNATEEPETNVTDNTEDDFFTVEDQEDGIEDIDLDSDDDGEEEIVVNAPTIKTKSKKNGMQFKIRSDKGTVLEIKYSKNGGKKWKKLSKKNIRFKYKSKKVTVTVKARAYIVLDDGSRVYSEWTYATEKCK